MEFHKDTNYFPCNYRHTDIYIDALHTGSVAPTSLYKCTKLELCTPHLSRSSSRKMNWIKSPLLHPSKFFSLSTWNNTSTLFGISTVKTSPCKSLYLLYKLDLKHMKLGTFSHMVTVTVFLSVLHHITAPVPSAGDS